MQIGIGISLTGGGRVSFSLASLFTTASGFDFTDLDVTKTWGAQAEALLLKGAPDLTTVSASGDAASWLLDKSQGLNSGPELVLNGGFSSTFASWTDQNAPTKTIVGARAKVVTTGGSEGIYQTTAATLGDTYSFRCDMEWESGQNGVFAIRDNAFGSDASVTNGGGSLSPRFLRRDLAAYRTFLYGGSTATAASNFFDNASMKKLPGNHAAQSTSAARPAWQANSGKPYLSFDGTDDDLLTALVPGAAMTIAACFRLPASAAATQIAMGSSGLGGANRAGNIGLLSTGAVCGGWGSDGATTITGGPAAMWSEDVVVLVRANGSTVELWLARSTGATRIYSATPNGTPNSTVPYALGGLNANSSLSNFFNGRMYGAVAVQSFIADADVIPLMRQLAALSPTAINF